ncbi:hypothetical protein J7E63_21315 [Bacillus sp. ISL-75]|uniref:DUF5659 domain-containing protein n=1 Tax=Bacillus sp. ISL-75 TaxID=2819137 RepID=UPI001BE8FA65|nr:DUF5659 domain-containing protein [Bacillus sp. ISL-75]MBT2729436.1 hypothetical protein [Bacillus sp. ISL-75]
MEKDYIVFSQRMAGYLMLNGCRLKKIKKSKKDETLFVYFFSDMEKVRNLVNEYNQQIKINGGMKSDRRK